MGNFPSSRAAPVGFESCLQSALPASAISLPSDLFYPLAVKPYNLAYDITPAAVIRPSATDQVSRAVQCASVHGVKVQARSGGHSYGDYSIGGEDGALVVDLVNFQQFSYDQSTGHATIGGGTLLDDVTKRLHDAGGRAMAHGLCPQVGIGGHATIGGIGPPSRMWGLSLDHVIEAEVVLANGTVVRTNENSSPEVLFALKGAGASFGVITEFKVITHPEPQEITQFTYRIELSLSSRDLVQTYTRWQEFISQPGLSRKFASQFIVFPLGMIVEGTYFGPRAEFDALGFAEKVASNASAVSVTVDDWLGSVANWATQEAINIFGGISAPFYSKSLIFNNDTLMSADTIQSVFSLFDSTDKGSLVWFAVFHLVGGAINDVPTDATSYPHRDGLMFLESYIIGVPGVTDQNRKWLNNINSVIENASPNANYGAYAGYVDPFLANSETRYWGNNYPRLQQIKSQIDPQDIFHNPQSVVGA
ncbi:hypothetical protein AAF712_011089 [Marasmius tenuissimus]|uniref:FAD-binding PCMH-type domain-containing protein n=1 Tax=Marasmius tenuissimus TaxID=585030 RepID=A0ABR2ZLX4_9AGAR